MPVDNLRLQLFTGSLMRGRNDMETYEIKINIADESELYNSFDLDRTTLNNDLIAYMTDRYTEKEFGKKAVFVFSGAAIDADHLRNVFNQHIEREFDKTVKETRINSLKQLRLLLIGVVFIAAGFFFSNYLDSIPVEILSIIGSFSVWEAANIWIVENPKLKLRNKLLTKLQEAEILVE